MMKKAFLMLVLSVFIFPMKAQVKLSDRAEISIITCSPTEDAVFTIYGHTAVRVHDPESKQDWVYNYGIFDFDKPYFIYRFAKGETDYKLEKEPFDRFLFIYQMRGSSVTEQILNLTPDEKSRIWEALEINALPENAVYRYNFFFDNCATRPVAIVEKYVDGDVVYNHPTEPQTFRQLINHCARNKPWLIFGTDLALGSPTERVATPQEEFFLPLYLQAAFDKATIKSPDGNERRLVVQTNILANEIPEDIEREIFTPLVCSILLLVVVLLVTGLEFRRKKHYRCFDCLLFLAAGLAGCVLFFLAFVSEHPATWPNWLIVWLHPFHLVGVALFAVKKLNKTAYYYHFINFAALTLFLAGWCFIPQQMNMAFIPLVISLWVRSAFNLKIGNK